MTHDSSKTSISSAPIYDNLSGDYFPLSELQNAYLIGRQKGVTMGGIGCQVYVELETPKLELNRLEQVWHALIERHDIMRLVIDDKLGQRVLSEVLVQPITTHDLRGFTGVKAHAKLCEIREDVAQQTFEPARWPLFDMRLIQEAKGDRLVFCFDLIAADAATVHYLINELSRTYRGETPMTISEVTYQEARTAQNKFPHRHARAQADWEAKLPTLPTGPELPYAINPSSIEAPRFSRVLTKISQDRADALSLKCASHGTTLPTVLNAVFAQVIAAWSHQRRFLLNMPIFVPALRDANKRAPLGNFTSNVLIDVDCTGATFKDDLIAINRSVRNSLRHRTYSGLSVMRDLRRMHGPMMSNGLIAPVVLTNLLAHQNAVDWDGLLGKLTGGVSRTPQVSLDHQIVQADDGIAFHWDYVEGLLAPDLIQIMSQAHLEFIHALVESDDAWTEPAQCVPQDQLETRSRQNDTSRNVMQQMLHDGFFLRAQAQPDAIAIIEGDVKMSYRALAARAHGIHTQLHEADIQIGDSVAVILPPGIAHSAAILGVLAAGAHYAPLAPQTPAARRAQELDLLTPQAIITTPEIAQCLPPNACRTIIHPTDKGSPRSLAASTPTDTAYIIFTSGTTGVPKGVMISHAAAFGTCADLIDRYALGADTRVLALSEPTFDLSIFDHFGIWSCGGTVIHPAAEHRGNPSSWLDCIERYEVNLWNSVPALMDLTTRAAQRSGRVFPNISRVMLSGDWIAPNLPQAIRTMAPNASLESLGGATEAAIWSLHHEITPMDSQEPSIPYGTPLNNQTLHVLDDRLCARPDDTEGALYIGGGGLAQGYLKQPAMTAKAFVVHPQSGQRLYRTGDLAKYRSDGEVILIGREDSQVKVQGLRVELGDVAQTLAAIPEVDQVLVEAIGTKFENKRLVAFAIPRADKSALGTVSSQSAPASTDLTLSFHPKDAAELRHCICQRQSPHTFGADVVSFSDLQKVLQVFIEYHIDGRKERVYPSEKASYCVQAFLSVEPDRVPGIAGGLYAVNPNGTLSVLSNEQMVGPLWHFPHNRAIAENAPFTILLFAKSDAQPDQYGSISRDQFLLEAGYIGQALTVASLETSVGLHPINAMDPSAVAHATGFIPRDFLHAVLGGIPQTEAAPDTAPSANIIPALRSAADAHLPVYLRPQDYILLDSFPITANGKIDRPALSQLADRAIGERTKTKPQTPSSLERALQQTCCEVLGLERVDLTTEFYAMGADSLRLVELAGVVEETFGVELDIAEVFENPTIRAIATLINSRKV
jgi:amino acid adenylation domain-containing protein